MKLYPGNYPFNIQTERVNCTININVKGDVVMIEDRHAKFLASRFYSDTVHITPHLLFPKGVNSISTFRAMANIHVSFCLTDHRVRRRLYFESRYSLTSCQCASGDV